MNKPIIFKNFRDFLLQDDFMDLEEFIELHKNLDDSDYLVMLDNSNFFEDEKYEIAIGIKYKSDVFNNDFEGYIVRTKDKKIVHGLYGFR